MQCPHCDTPSLVRSSRALSRTLRELEFQCHNHICGHTWVATLEAVRTLSPSSMPHQEVHLPLSPVTELRRAAAELRNDPRQGSLSV
nr:ogr/Delta-like zinc finger family protein [Bordetella sp. H567]